MDEFDTPMNSLLIAQSLSLNDEENLLQKLQGLVTNIKWSPTDAVKLFDALLKRFQSTTTDSSHLVPWMLDMLHCIEINYITSSWRYQADKTLTDLLQDKTVTDENIKKYLADDREKQLDEILEEIRQQKLNQIDETLLEAIRDIVSSVDKDLNKGLTLNNDGSQWIDLKKALLRLCRTAQITQKDNFTPRLTQMVSWCLMALSNTARLIQVGTGEGKSCIVAMFAAFRALKGEKVDIMSSSSVLAKRDSDDWSKFYKALNITVSCNTNKQDNDLNKCYQCQVVYGTVEQFAGDWLRQHFHKKDIFGQRTFQCAIVDEVDSLMLDKGLHVVYLSSDMPALQHLNPLLAFIWATANRYSKIGTEITVGPKYLFHEVVLENITNVKGINEVAILQIAEDTGILAKGVVMDLRKNLDPEKTASVSADQLADFFQTVERRFPSCQFALHIENNDGTIKELNKRPQKVAEEHRVPLLLSNGGFCQYMYSDTESVRKAAEGEIKRALHFTPCELTKDKGSCYIPGFLSDLVESNLKVWIENAFYAQTMTMDHEYIIERHGVVPVDYSCTGVVENFMQWSDGLHQFLEMKHGSKMNDMTAITNYMSNVGLLQKYKAQIFGISGTLGEQAETETLQKIYKGIKTCQIPSFKRRKLFEVEGVVVKGEKEWIEKICDVVTAQTNLASYRKQRAVLVICETINRAKVLDRALENKVCNKNLYINNNMDNTATIDTTLKAGEVIIATNLAGRGTDLKVSEVVKEAGGLFVVQTFLPKNARVEAQAFGRTARQGAPGSAQLIVCSSHLPITLQMLVLTKELLSLLEDLIDETPLYKSLFVRQLRLYDKNHSDGESMSLMLSCILTENSKSALKIAKEARDDLVAEGLASYVESDIPKIKKKEKLFTCYLEILNDVYKNSNNKPAESDLSALNEFWGLWLLTNFDDNDSIEVLQSRLRRDIDRARQKLRQRESPSSNLHHYTVFGNELRERGHLADSIKLYTKAIQEDSCWAAVAYYNRAFASLTQQGRCQDRNCINQALEDLQNALKSVELYCEQIEVTYRYYTQQIKPPHSDFTTRFNKHIIARCTVLQLFIANINAAIKKVDSARVFGGNVKVEESLVYFLLPLEYFLPLINFSVESVHLIRSRDPLKVHQLISHPTFDIFNELRCLESLGLTHIYTLDTLFSLGGFFSKIMRS